ncbi:MAG: hypothetical protein HOP28_18615 [Gemmatimonadales bacterium]|nr:hypothetical protein [Gemmatimonadales bacterium]
MTPSNWKLAITLFALAACSNPASPEDGLLVSTAVTPSVIRTGERTLIRVTVLNHGKDIVRLDTFSCNGGFEVAFSNGVVVPPWVVCSTRLGEIKNLAPGESYSEEGEWNGYVGSASNIPIYLAPDTYTIRGKFALNGTIVTGRATTVEILP